MIRELEISNFKCFRRETLELRRLTLLTGVNSSGKSTFIQAMLLMRQAFESSQRKFVELNGPYYLQLGQAANVTNYESSGRNIRLTARGTDVDRLCQFKVAEDLGQELVLPISRLAPSQSPGSGGQDLLAPAINYLHAERLGPRDFSDLASVPVDQLSVGARGEFTAHALLKHERHRLPSDRIFLKSEGNDLLRQQVEMWMRPIMPGIELRIDEFVDMNLTAARIKKKGVQREWQRPPNTGFGVSYSLPIVVAGLIAPADSLLIVENPEAHLHPAGQSHVGGFLAKMAAAGVQVIIETHSDHVLNGIRLATVSDGGLRPDQVIVHYFQAEPEVHPMSLAIELDPLGGMSQWPKGFFDQSEHDLAEILRARKKR